MLPRVNEIIWFVYVPFTMFCKAYIDSLKKLDPAICESDIKLHKHIYSVY